MLKRDELPKSEGSKLQPMGQIGPLTCFVNKILLKHSHKNKNELWSYDITWRKCRLQSERSQSERATYCYDSNYVRFWKSLSLQALWNRSGELLLLLHWWSYSPPWDCHCGQEEKEIDRGQIWGTCPLLWLGVEQNCREEEESDVLSAGGICAGQEKWQWLHLTCIMDKFKSCLFLWKKERTLIIFQLEKHGSIEKED